MLRRPINRLGLIAGLLVGLSPALLAQVASQTPKELEGIGVVEKAGQKIDLNLTFTATNGYPVALKDLFHKDRAVILTMVYYDCPMLCSRVLNALIESLREIPWTPGKEFDIVTVSFDPNETFKLAGERRQVYLANYERPAPGWTFLADHDNNAQKLADQLGFKYRYDEKIRQYAHTAVIMVLSPDGTISRYLYGLRFNPRDVRLALTEASDFKFAFTMDRLLLFCYHYDPTEKSYVPFAMNVMRTGGVLVVLIMGLGLWRLFRQERRTAASGGVV